MEDDSLIQLGGFALSEVLAQLGLDSSATDSLSHLGLASRSSAISKDSIYNGKFVDAPPSPSADDTREDLEAEVDRELYDEKWKRTSTTTAREGLLRGEEDDFDDSDEGSPQPAANVKLEPASPAPSDLFGSSPSSSPPAAAAAAAAAAPSQKPLKEKSIHELFPAWEKGKILDFTALFGGSGPGGAAGRARKKAKVGDGLKLDLPSSLPAARSTRDALVAPLQPRSSRSTLHLPSLLPEVSLHSGPELSSATDSQALVSTFQKKGMHVPDPERETTGFAPVELDDWESRIVWDAMDMVAPPTDLLAPRNAPLAAGDWTSSILWSSQPPASLPSTTGGVELNLNDPMMFLEVSYAGLSEADKPADAPVTSGSGGDMLDLSNDAEYRASRGAAGKQRVVRQTFGLLEVQHAYPAQKLQLPFYKTRLTKADARAFHRPPIQFPQNVALSFAKVRSRKKKDKQGRKIRKGEGEAMRTMGDMSLRDTGAFWVWEYSEENPPIISNIGMGTILVNYYRKKHPDDDFVPQLDVGEPFLLDVTDESPFKAFGSVQPGQTVPTLYNNLVRAPVFRHQPNETDFVLVRTTIEGEVKYYLRALSTLFVVGQTYPLTEVPGPHSRKVSTLVKNRLQTITFKLINKHPKHRIKVNRLTKYFPDQSDLQMRQRLKEFMEFNRKGDNQGFWMVKRHIPIPDDAEMLKLATPEMVCLAEAMQVGLRHLQDAGYGQTAEEGGAGDDDSRLDIEQQLAPWITTKNFLNANANKAMLKLHGDGDPTGRGEAFSFLRVSMKEIFLRAGEDLEAREAQIRSRPKSAHKYNVQEQQDIYKEEIARIWAAQWNALSNPVEPQLSPVEEDRQRGGRPRGLPETPGSLAGTPRDAWGSGGVQVGTPGSRASTPDKEDGMSVGSGRGGGHKILRVRRLVNGQWETEVVRDPGIIKAYVKQRQTIDEERTDADDLLPSDDEGKNERRKKRLREQLEKLKRNQERRLARKNQKLGIAPGAVGVGGKRAAKPETTRVCGNCGQRGHMKTSKRLCPRWHEFNAPKEVSQTGSLPTAFGSGLALPSISAAPPPLAASPPAPRPALKLKLTGAMSPPQMSPPPF